MTYLSTDALPTGGALLSTSANDNTVNGAALTFTNLGFDLSGSNIGPGTVINDKILRTDCGSTELGSYADG